jgi:hypothetical protein
MNQVDYKFYSDLKAGAVSVNKTPKSVLNSAEFQALLNSNVISRVKSGRGSLWSVKKEKTFESFLQSNFPEIVDTITRASNIKAFRNSKARSISNQPIFLVRGFSNAVINGEMINIEKYTKEYGLFAFKAVSIVCDNICFIENLETFLHAEKLLGNNYLFLHKYGRIGVKAIQGIQAKHVLVFVDYDFNGLDEYLRIKRVFPECILYLPDGFEDLFKKYSREMKGKQKQSKSVKDSSLSDVIRIRELVEKKSRFLEQECLISE